MEKTFLPKIFQNLDIYTISVLAIDEINLAVKLTSPGEEEARGIAHLGPRLQVLEL